MLRQFIESMEKRDGWGKSLINPTGKGLLSAANPKNSAVPPMELVGSCLLPLVFAPVNQIFRVKFRLVRGLPYAMVLGAAFMTDSRSIISFDAEEGFRSTPSSSWIPFAPREVGEAEAGAMCAESDQYRTVKPSTDEQKPEELEKPKIPAGIMGLGSCVWEDEGTLHWKLRIAKDVEVQGGTSIQVDAFVKVPQPQVQELVVVEPTNHYDLKIGLDLGVPRGAQWWSPGIPLQCKLSNVTQENVNNQGGLVNATVYAVNNYDRERIKSLMNPVSEEPTSPKQDEGIKKKDKGRPPEQCNKGGEIAEIPSEAPKVDLGEANFG